MISFSSSVFNCAILWGFQAKKTEINESQKKVNEILTESQAIVKEEFFKEHERDHFQGRIDMIDKRNKGLEEKADKEERRYSVT